MPDEHAKNGPHAVAKTKHLRVQLKVFGDGNPINLLYKNLSRELNQFCCCPIGNSRINGCFVPPGKVP